MSHVAEMSLMIEDLDALEDACKMIGLQLIKGQTTYRWFGQFVGDAPLPQGFTKEELGKCLHAIKIPNNHSAYEIGIVKSKTGKGYTLLLDEWAGGYGLVNKIGTNGGLLKQAYVIARSKKEAIRQGKKYRVEKKDKKMRLVVSA